MKVSIDTGWTSWGLYMRQVYNQVSDSYRKEADSDVLYEPYVNRIRQMVPRSSLVVDLGCGCGIPLTRMLVKDYRVLGVDASDVQLSRAQELVPNARFVQADMSTLHLEEESVEAVVALFSIIHMPPSAQQNLIRRVRRWLRADGIFLFTAGGSEWSGYRDNWHGVRMYWWQEAAQLYLSWAREVGFTVEEFAVSRRGAHGHSLLVCRR